MEKENYTGKTLRARIYGYFTFGKVESSSAGLQVNCLCSFKPNLWHLEPRKVCIPKYDHTDE